MKIMWSIHNYYTAILIKLKNIIKKNKKTGAKEAL